MNRLLVPFFMAMLMLSSACNTAQTPAAESARPEAEQISATFFVNQQGDTIQRVIKTADEWKAQLDNQEFYVLRQAGTERAFTGDLWDHKGAGVYTCAGCGLPLFESDTKFKSGTGWPSFYEPLDGAHVKEIEDRSHGMIRTEVVCGRCNGHLGHVFPDGPKPTGLRYCINSVSLNFEEQ